MKTAIALTVTLAATFLVIAPHSDAADAPMTAGRLAHMLDADGPAGASRRLTQPQWDFVLDRMAQGDADFLALAQRLSHGGNASGNEGIRISVSNALRTNPDAVLPLLGPRFPVQEICGDLDIEPTPEALKSYYDKAIPAVQAAGLPSFRATRDACLVNLLLMRRRELGI